MEDYSPDIITVIDDDGNEVEFEKLDEYEDEVTGKTYFALTEYPESDDGELIILISEENDEGEFILLPIEDENEFDAIGVIFKQRLADMFNFTDDNTEE